MQHSGRFIIIFFVYMIVVSGLLVAGIRSDIRQLINTTPRKYKDIIRVNM
jgi:hypothetical protein